MIYVSRGNQKVWPRKGENTMFYIDLCLGDLSKGFRTIADARKELETIKANGPYSAYIVRGKRGTRVRAYDWTYNGEEEFTADDWENLDYEHAPGKWVEVSIDRYYL